MLAAKMFVIQTRNYILKLVNSSVALSVLFSILPKWHVIKTKHTCRFGESGIGRTSGGWKFPEPTSLREVGSGNFQPPEVRPIPDSPPCKYVCYIPHCSLKSTYAGSFIFDLHSKSFFLEFAATD